MKTWGWKQTAWFVIVLFGATTALVEAGLADEAVQVSGASPSGTGTAH
jgi:hypothetical protein